MRIDRLEPKLEPIEGAKVDWTRNFSGYDDKGEVIVDYDDIVYKKLKLLKLFNEDPDLLDMLDMPQKIIPIAGMTDEQKQEIADHNERISVPEIIPWLKLNGVVKTVSNKILFDIETERNNYDNKAFSRQHLIVMCLVDETAMDTDYGIPRVDLVAYIVKDLINRTDYLGMNALLYSDVPKIVDDSFYCRELRFIINQPNFSNSHSGTGNRYDHFRPV